MEKKLAASFAGAVLGLCACSSEEKVKSICFYKKLTKALPADDEMKLSHVDDVGVTNLSTNICLASVR